MSPVENAWLVRSYVSAETPLGRAARRCADDLLRATSGRPMELEREQTCLTLREEVESLAHAIEVVGFSDALEAFDVSRDEAERGALSTLQKVLDLFIEHGLGEDAV